MITIISPEQFSTFPWKNGKGETIQLAINQGGTVELFDWRLSIASVTEDGLFSDFSGYYRHLVLIEGLGITLKHNHQSSDQLNELLSIAQFDGGNHTSCALVDGGIKDFNIMTNQKTYRAKVKTFNSNSTVALSNNNLIFCFGLSGLLSVENFQENYKVPSGSLIRIENASNSVERTEQYTITGSNFILIELIRL